MAFRQHNVEPMQFRAIKPYGLIRGALLQDALFTSQISVAGLVVVPLISHRELARLS